MRKDIEVSDLHVLDASISAGKGKDMDFVPNPTRLSVITTAKLRIAFSHRYSDSSPDLVSDRPGHRCWAFKVWGTNKAVEIEKIPSKESPSGSIFIYDIELRIRRKIGHPGFRISFNTPWNKYSFLFYDIRHWNRENDEYEDHQGA